MISLNEAVLERDALARQIAERALGGAAISPAALHEYAKARDLVLKLRQAWLDGETV